MLHLRRLFSVRTPHLRRPFPSPITNHSVPTRLEVSRSRFHMASSSSSTAAASLSSSFPADEARHAPTHVTLPLNTSDKDKLYRGLESVLNTKFSSEPLIPPAQPLIIVISGPSGVGKDAVIKRLREVRQGIHFIVTATSRAKRPGEIEGKDYYFVSKEEFLSMIERNELIEYALVYGDYKGIPKQQIREHMAKGYDIVLRVDIQGAETLKSIFGKSAVFIFLAAESEAALVKRLIDRKTETSDMLLVRIATAKEELKRVKCFDYVVVNEEGKLDKAVELVEGIIDAEKCRVDQRNALV
ncbi:hypothetical protein LUZ60_013221 [Juncus effusus]|nr:hypothetical protein LUZ60_013221 [Juncus effusus]